MIKIKTKKRNRLMEEVRSLKLNAQLSVILRKIKKERVIRPPKPIIHPLKSVTRKKICEFHRDHGHTIDECLTLKGQIYALIWRN